MGYSSLSLFELQDEEGRHEPVCVRVLGGSGKGEVKEMRTVCGEVRHVTAIKKKSSTGPDHTLLSRPQTPVTSSFLEFFFTLFLFVYVCVHVRSIFNAPSYPWRLPHLTHFFLKDDIKPGTFPVMHLERYFEASRLVLLLYYERTVQTN